MLRAVPRARRVSEGGVEQRPQVVPEAETGKAQSPLLVDQLDPGVGVVQQILLDPDGDLLDHQLADPPHEGHERRAAGVLYVEVDGAPYVTTSGSSANVHNIRENRRVAVCIPVRSCPLFPPFCVPFQGSATLHASDDPAITALLASGRPKKITSHGELDDPDTCLQSPAAAPDLHPGAGPFPSGPGRCRATRWPPPVSSSWAERCGPP